jgi:hypothetical protein
VAATYPQAVYPDSFSALPDFGTEWVEEKVEAATRRVGEAVRAAETRPAIAPATKPLVAALRPASAPVAEAPATKPAAGGLPIAAAQVKPAIVTDEQIGRSIQRGVDFLLAQFEADEVVVREPPNDTYREAVNALCVYALLSAGRSIDDARLKPASREMADLIERMNGHLMSVSQADSNAPVVYGRSLRAQALSVYNRPGDRAALSADVQYLLKAHRDGAFTYNDRLTRWDQPRTNTPASRRAVGEGLPGGREREDDDDDDRRNRRYVLPESLRGLSEGALYYVDPGAKGRRVALHNGEPTVPRMPQEKEAYREPPEMPWDNSNTQYGLLGVWAAAEAGVEVPTDFFVKADQHWKRWIFPTGEWGYNRLSRDGYFAMTVAGVTSLFVSHEVLEAPQLGGAVGRDPFSAELARALAWLEKGDNAINIEHGPVHSRGYSLYGLQRAALASGFKYFGRNDWYRELAYRVIHRQHPNGSWGPTDKAGEAETIIDTAFTVLFLSRPRGPVMMNKLRFEGYWANRPRDLANLARFASREFERPLNWQVVNLRRDWSDWMDSPVLYVASHAAPKFTDADLAKLRSFALAGGLLFTHADGSAMRFNDHAIQLARKLFPEFELAAVPAGHPVYDVHYEMSKHARPGQLPQLRAVNNGARLLMVHSAHDLSSAWQARDGSRRGSWEIGVNLFVYAAGGKDRDLRNRLDSPYIEEPPLAGNRWLRAVPVARVKYGGNFDPEPYAWQRFARWFKGRTSWELQPKVTAFGDLRAEDAPLAHLTGVSALAATDEELAALKRYVEGGGVLLIDDCGGSGAFSGSMREAVERALGGKFQGVSAEHPVMRPTYGGMVEMAGVTPQFRSYTDAKFGDRKPGVAIEMLDLGAGKGKALLVPVDLTSGLLGTHTWGVHGYHPNYAQALMSNVVLWSANAVPHR